MTNKMFTYLTLFLLLPLTTQCMEKNHAELIKKRDEFKKELDNQQYVWWFGLTSCPNMLFVSSTYHQDLHKKTYCQVSPNLEKFKKLEILDVKYFNWLNIDNLKNIKKDQLEILRGTRRNTYSGLGSATMAEKVTFEEKQEFIQKLLDLGFIPTSEDKELALVEQWERWLPIIHKICILRYAQFFIEIPCVDVTKLIEQLMLKTEKSLF